MPVYNYVCDKCNKEYDEFLKMADCKQETKCPDCGEVGRRDYSMRQSEPTFTDKLYPYWDRALNKVFHNKNERSAHLEKVGLRENGGETMNRKQEQMMYKMRLGNHDPSLRKYTK